MTAALRAVVREIELHAAAAGWDTGERIYALVETADLVRREPALAASLGLADTTGLTPVEQEPVAAGETLEGVLARIAWPDEVSGCAAVAERLVLPAGADDDLPDEPAAAAEYAASHPDRQEVRIVAAALRTGESACALRLRSHDDDQSVLTGPDLVPDLLGLLRATLDLEETDHE
jgi:hypothetical protein